MTASQVLAFLDSWQASLPRSSRWGCFASGHTGWPPAALKPTGQSKGSTPAKPVKGVVIKTEVVADLVYHSHGDLLHQIALGVTCSTDRKTIKGDPVGHRQATVVHPFGQRDALIQAHQPLFRMCVLDDHNDIVHDLPKGLGQRIESPGHKLPEAALLNQKHDLTVSSHPRRPITLQEPRLPGTTPAIAPPEANSFVGTTAFPGTTDCGVVSEPDAEVGTKSFPEQHERVARGDADRLDTEVGTTTFLEQLPRTETSRHCDTSRQQPPRSTQHKSRRQAPVCRKVASMSGDEHPLLAGLTPEQRDAVTTRASPLCIIAGAGSGKTRVLTRRIAWQAEQGLADPRRMLAVTFTRRASRELRARLRRLGLNDNVKSGTFHAIALAQLRRHAADASQRPPRILAKPQQLIVELRPRSAPKKITEVVNEINWAKARLVTPDQYATAARQTHRKVAQGDSGRFSQPCADHFSQLYADYESIKHQRRLLDFNDVLVDALDLMTTDPRHAAARRWLHQHLLVDEFQDINPLQFELLRSWSGPDSTLLLVGDPDQAIFGWNGADPDLIHNVRKLFSGCAVKHLRSNFRSTPEILAAAGRVLDKQPQSLVKPSGREVEVTVCDGEDEGIMLARAVRHRHLPGGLWRRQAVLARTNEQLLPLRQALTRQNIPVNSSVYSKKVADGLLEKPWVTAVLSCWPSHASLSDCVADCRQELRSGNTPPLATPANADNGTAPANADGGTALVNADGGTALVNADGGTALVNMDDDAALDELSRTDIAALLELSEDHLALEPDATVGSFRTALLTGERLTASADGVNLLTFHSAKGLEWPVVHIVGLEDGFVPIRHARSEAARAEERRLLYVAITRAEQELHLMWCTQRNMAGHQVRREPSPWLDTITAAEPRSANLARNLSGVAAARQALKPRSEE